MSEPSPGPLPEAPPPLASLATPEPGDGTGGVIPYRNVPALIAYYCGIFSLIPCLGIPVGVAGVILGTVGLRRARAQPAVHGQVHAWIGIILGGLCALLWLLALILIFLLPALQ